MDKEKHDARLRFAFASYLSANGLRFTPERSHILKVVLTFTRTFGSVELWEACKADDSMRVSRATVFNSLSILERAGILRRIAFDRTVSYEVIRQKLQLRARQHLVCSECGKVRRLQAPLLAEWVGCQSYRDFFPAPESAVLTVNGLCGKCRRKKSKKSK